MTVKSSYLKLSLGTIWEEQQGLTHLTINWISYKALRTLGWIFPAQTSISLGFFYHEYQKAFGLRPKPYKDNHIIMSASPKASLT